MFDYVVGVDEAGRGPLAGPVSIGVCVVSKDFDFSVFEKLKDSKKLSEKRRVDIFKQMKILKNEKKLDFHVSLISNKFIDRHGIVSAINRGIIDCFSKLNLDSKTVKIFLDGGIKAPSHFIYQETIIKGDEKIPVISLASISAKVTRDFYMKNIVAKEFVDYGFEKHVGYGTKSHIEAIRKQGISNIHRITFLDKILAK